MCVCCCSHFGSIKPCGLQGRQRSMAAKRSKVSDVQQDMRDIDLSDMESEQEASRCGSRRTAASQFGADSCGEDSEESLEIQCVGCKLTSKDNCPIALGRTGKQKRLMWGRTTMRKKRRRGHIVRQLSRCGVWCGICWGLFRYRFAESHGPAKKFKKKLSAGSSYCEKTRKMWLKARKEYERRKIDGENRVYHLKAYTMIVSDDHDVTEVIEPDSKFYGLKKYKKTFGDPKETKAKVQWLTLRGGRKIRGVYVKPEDAEDDIYTIRNSRRRATGTHDVHDDGTCIVDAEQQVEALEEGRKAMAADAIDMTGAASASQLLMKREEAVVAAGADDSDGHSASESSDSDEKSDKSSSDSSNDGTKDEADADAEPVRKRGHKQMKTTTCASPEGEDEDL